MFLLAATAAWASPCGTGTDELRARLEGVRGTAPVAHALSGNVDSLGGLVLLEDRGHLTRNLGSVWDLADRRLVASPTPGGFLASLTSHAEATDDLGEQVASWGGGFEEVPLPLPFVFPLGESSWEQVYLSSTLQVRFEPQERPEQTDQYLPADLLGGPPRITPLGRPTPWMWANLIDLYVREDVDRVVISWVERTRRPDLQPHLDRLTQVELHADGTVVMAWPDQLPFNTFGAVQLVANDGGRLGDVSRLTAEPTFVGGISEAFTLPALDLEAVEAVLGDTYGLNDGNLDAMVVYQTFYTDLTFWAGAFHQEGRSGDRGVGRRHGAPRTSLIHLNHWDLEVNRPIDARPSYILNHELGHRWLLYVDGVDGLRVAGHASQAAHLPAAASWWRAQDASCMGGTLWTDHGDGSFSTPSEQAYYGYSWFELYLMGLADPAEVEAPWYVGGPEALQEPYYPPLDSTWYGEAEPVDLDRVIAANGRRDPAWPDAKRDFDVAFVLVYRAQDPPIEEATRHLRQVMATWPGDWHAAVAGRAEVHVELDAIREQGASDCDFNGRDDAFDDDTDRDGVADACDVCPLGDDRVDTDDDGVADACDRCPFYDDNRDADGDGVPDGCDPVSADTTVGSDPPEVRDRREVQRRERIDGSRCACATGPVATASWLLVLLGGLATRRRA